MRVVFYMNNGASVHGLLVACVRSNFWALCQRERALGGVVPVPVPVTGGRASGCEHYYVPLCSSVMSAVVYDVCGYMLISRSWYKHTTTHR